MSFRLVSSGGFTGDPAMINMRASGTIHVGGVVDFSVTSGVGVQPASAASSQSYIFGVAYSYLQGASDMEAKVIPFAPNQVWEADCARAAATAHINIKHILRDDKILENTATNVAGVNGVFLCIGMSSSTSGSGKLLGYFVQTPRSSG